MSRKGVWILDASHPVIQSPASNIQYPVSSTLYPVSSNLHPAPAANNLSSIIYPFLWFDTLPVGMPYLPHLRNCMGPLEYLRMCIPAG